VRGVSTGHPSLPEKNRGLVMGYYVERHETGKPGDVKRDNGSLEKTIGGLVTLWKVRGSIQVRLPINDPILASTPRASKYVKSPLRRATRPGATRPAD
jgi:transposase